MKSFDSNKTLVETGKPGSNQNQDIRQTTWILLAALMLTLILSGCDKKPKVYRVGILSGIDVFAGITDGFKAKMTELGYIEGKNIVYDVQNLNADPAGEQRIANKFVSEEVDLILAFPSSPTAAAKAATKKTQIPVVFGVATLEGNDLVESVRRPGGNMTGVRYPGPERIVKRLELLLDLAPAVKRVWLNANPDHPATAGALEALRPAALSRGITLIEARIRKLDDLKADLQARAKTADLHADAILVLPESVAQSPAGWSMLSQFAAAQKIPIAGNSASQLKQGAVFTYAPDTLESGRLAAVLADKILHGTPPGTIPVVTPESHLKINYITAQKLGLKVREGFLKMADEILR